MLRRVAVENGLVEGLPAAYPNRICFCDEVYPDYKEPDDLMKFLVKQYMKT